MTKANIIGSLFITYFLDLFSSSRPLFPSNLQGLIDSSIDSVLNTSFSVGPSEAKIYKTIFLMQENKSLGPDGMTPLFYKTFWSIIGKDFIIVVQ